VRVEYGEAATDDIVRQFRYYWIEAGVPEVADRFERAITQTMKSLGGRPYLGRRFSPEIPQYRELRSWQVAGFEIIRIYYEVDTDVIRIIRVLHGMRNVRRILENE
jgi:toxin ParE1/3/4